MAEILEEMEQGEEESQENKVSSSLFESRNSEFLNKEISFFIDNLRKVTKKLRVSIESSGRRTGGRTVDSHAELKRQANLYSCP